MLIGLGGNDVLIGGEGAANILQGGTGDDVYYVGAAGDSVIEAAGEGIDTVSTSLAVFTLSANVENLVFTGSAAVAGVGNAGDNTIISGAGADTLNGGAGADTLSSGLGNDILIGGAGAGNTLIGGAGDDLYFVSVTGDSIVDMMVKASTRCAPIWRSIRCPRMSRICSMVAAGTSSATATMPPT